MQCIIGSDRMQELDREWFGGQVTPPWLFRFTLGGDCLVFRAAREGIVRTAPYAEPGAFTADLWKYDTAEFFIAAPDARRYLELNLALNGAWWGAVFTQPRVPDPDFGLPVGITTHAAGGAAELHLPLAPLAAMGISPGACRLAAAAIIRREDGTYTFLTTADHCGGKPDFHQPDTWSTPLLHS